VKFSPQDNRENEQTCGCKHSRATLLHVLTSGDEFSG
jgi:hypothetical protein